MHEQEHRNDWLVAICITWLWLLSGLLHPLAVVVIEVQDQSDTSPGVGGALCDETTADGSGTLRLAEWLWRIEGRWWGAFRRSTWSSVCHDGSERPWPAPAGPCRYSALRRGCPPHCQEEKTEGSDDEERCGRRVASSKTSKSLAMKMSLKYSLCTVTTVTFVKYIIGSLLLVYCCVSTL